MIYETYTCMRSDGGIEYGFCFKADHDSDDNVAPDIMIGITYDEEPAEMIEAAWIKWEWMAQAVVKGRD